MVNFTELYITPNNQKLVLDVSVSELPYFADVYLKTIYIDTEDTYTEGEPSSKAFKYTVNGDLKNLRLELNSPALGFSLEGKLLFIYVETKGMFASETPCGMDENMTVVAVYNQYPIYTHIMSFIKAMNTSCCEIPAELVNAVLQYKVFELSINLKHYLESIKFWKKFISNYTNFSLTSNCNCNG
jgi:hypothetical protein